MRQFKMSPRRQYPQTEYSYQIGHMYDQQMHGLFWGVFAYTCHVTCSKLYLN